MMREMTKLKMQRIVIVITKNNSMYENSPAFTPSRLIVVNCIATLHHSSDVAVA